MADDRTAGGTPGREGLDAEAFLNQMGDAITSGTSSGRDATVAAFRDLGPLQRMAVRVAARVAPGLAISYLSNKLGYGKADEDFRRIGVDDFVSDLRYGDPGLRAELRGEPPVRPATGFTPIVVMADPPAGPAEGAGPAGGNPDGAAASSRSAAAAAFGEAVQPLTGIDPNATGVQPDPAANKGAQRQQGAERDNG